MVVPVVGKAENTAERLKKDGKSGIIQKTEGTREREEKAARIEREFRYTDARGERSPIDRASFAAMPINVQEQAAAGIRKARELFHLDTLPDKITFGNLRNAFGSYNETTRILTLSKSRCKDPAEAYSTMIHEMAHYYDHVSGHISEGVYKQALKELGLRGNSKETGNLLFQLIGTKYKKEERIPEAFAFAAEVCQRGTKNKLATKIFEILTR